MSIPKSIVHAVAIDQNTSRKYVLKYKIGSRCHFFDRFPAGRYEVQLRLDWGDLDSNDDPKLDADIYFPGDTKPIKGSTRFPSHHTPKQKDTSTGLYLYEFALDGVSLLLQIQFTQQQHITGVARIAPALEDPQRDPELDEWFEN
jgi:hypothetical protein